MITKDSINFELSKIEEMWSPGRRFQIFGDNLLQKVILNNIRGVSGEIEFNWPITVIGGPNGCGKSTVMNVCSTAYDGSRQIGSIISRTYISGETHPLQSESKIVFEYGAEFESFSAKYDSSKGKWTYNEKRPHRRVLNINFFTFPVTRSRDVIQASEKGKNKRIDVQIIKRLSNVLGISYEGGYLSKVQAQKKGGTVKLRQLQQNKFAYSEHHMSAGERKVLDLMLALENIPERSLILLEEIENNLHPEAQRGLAWYLLNVCRRRKHQIIIATHSTEIFETMPRKARILVSRSGSRADIVQGVSRLHSMYELSGTVKMNKPLILVEDVTAQKILSEILRRYCVDLFDGVAIVPVGDTKDIADLVKTFRENQIYCVGVRDADKGESATEGLLSLPGNKFPEADLLSSDNVERAESFVSGIKDSFEQAKASGLGYEKESTKYKQIFDELASHLRVNNDQLITWLVLAWLLDDDNIQGAKDLVRKLQILLNSV